MMHLNARLLITGMIGLMSCGSIAYGAEERLPEEAEKGYAASGIHTPVKAAAVSEATVDLTPGQKIAERQREIFVRERFEAVFGASAIEELTHSKGISWDVLTDTSIPFDDADKRAMILRISKFMEKLFTSKARETKFQDLFGEVMDIKVIVDTVPEDRLEEHARRYFTTGRFEGASVEFRPKNGGDQLGSVAIVRPTEGPAVKYYVKTHAGGTKTFLSTGAKPVDAIELLAYKVLEGFGVGCEAHFFGRDEQNFYIATRDANEYGGFEEYSRVDRKNKASTQPIWGVLSEVLVAPMVTDDTERVRVEAAIATDRVAQNFIEQMSMLDVLARLMLLTDLQTNGGNFGFVKREGELPVLKVIDFRLRDTDNFRLTERDFGGFLVGNGLFNYVTADRATGYALHDRAVGLRVKEGLKIFEKVLAGWEEKIEAAKINTLGAVEKSGMSGEEIIRLRAKLETHAETLKGNFRLFEEMLRGYRGD